MKFYYKKRNNEVLVWSVTDNKMSEIVKFSPSEWDIFRADCFKLGIRFIWED